VNFEDFARRFGQNVRRARWSAGLTLEALAAKTISFRLLGEIERGRGNPTLGTIFTLARALGVAPHELLAPESKSKPTPTPPKRGRKPKVRSRPSKTS
jgi:XRE family aerobic/anaerobic benzoate catabolism transcriptional regulator